MHVTVVEARGDGGGREATKAKRVSQKFNPLSATLEFGPLYFVDKLTAIDEYAYTKLFTDA